MEDMPVSAEGSGMAPAGGQATGAILLNAAYPLNDEQRAATEQMLGWSFVDVRNQRTTFSDEPLAEQVRALVERFGLTVDEWQHRPIAVVPPGLAPACATFL